MLYARQNIPFFDSSGKIMEHVPERLLMKENRHVLPMHSLCCALLLSMSGPLPITMAWAAGTVTPAEKAGGAAGTPTARGTVATPSTPTDHAAARQAACTCSPADLPQILRVDVASFLGEIVYNERQHAVYVAAPGSTPRDESPREPPRVLRLDPQTLKVQAEIALPYRGFGMALDEDGQKLYVGHSFEGAVSILDLSSGKVLKTLDIVERKRDDQGREEPARHLRELVFDRAHQRLYLLGLDGRDSTLYVVDTRKAALEKRIPGFGFQATGITLDGQGGRVFVSNMQGQLMSVDRRTLQRLKTQEVAADQLLNLTFDSGRHLVMGVDQGVNRNAWRNQHLGRTYVPRSEGHQVVMIDPDSGKVAATLETDKHPLALLLDEERQRLYVSTFNGIQVEDGRGTLQVFDSRTRHLLQTIALPPHAASLALDARRNVLYVTIKNDGRHEKAGSKEQVARIAFRSTGL